MNQRQRRLPSSAAACMVVAATFLFVLGLDLSARAQDPELPSVTETYALEDARVVQTPGRVLDSATVLIREGIIEAVGTEVDIPYDARRIDADTLTVYPGFIDGLSHAGVEMPEEGEEQEVEDPGDPPPDRAGIQPDRSVRSLLNANASTLDSLRRLGFTAGHVVPEGGMLPGSGAHILYGGEDADEMVLETNQTLFAQIEGAPAQAYPSTGMAVLAQFRQLYREAERRRAIEDSYARQPDGARRPPRDPVHTALFPVLDGDTPFAFHADGALAIHRVLDLQEDLGFPLVLTGLAESHETIDVLDEADAPYFLTLDLPEERDYGGTDTTLADTTDRPYRHYDPDLRVRSREEVEEETTNLNLRHKIERLNYEATAARLEEAGIRFGFSTRNVALEEVREHLRTLIERGLPEDSALAALTTRPAALLGLENRLGTVETGKIANLLVTDGPYFEEDTRVRQVFVDGKLYEYETEDDENGEESSDEKSGDTGKNGEQDDSDEKVADESRADDEDAIAPTSEELAVADRPRKRMNATDDWLIRGGTVLTVTQGTIENGDVLVRNGTIAEVGTDLEAPEDVTVYDASGEYVTPGLIDAHQHMAISHWNEATNPVTPEVSVGDVLDPYDLSIYRALAGGMTAAHVMHGSANPIGGRHETIKLRYGATDPDSLRFEGAPRTVKFALGENPTRVYGEGYDMAPRTRMGVEQVIREALVEARRYRDAKDAYQEGERNRPPPYSLRREVLVDVLNGEVIPHVHSYRADEILTFMRVMEEFGVEDVVFQHVNEGFKVAPELAAFGDDGAGASVFSDWWAYKFEVYYSTAYNAAILTENDVLTSINTDIPGEQRDLYLQAAKTLRYGDLSRNEALSLITINPARQLGIADRVGSIEEGKDADIAIFSAHPLSVYTKPQRTYVDGIVRFDHADDPDDMRLRVDPEGRVSMARDGAYTRPEVGGCRHGAFLRVTGQDISLEQADQWQW